VAYLGPFTYLRAADACGARVAVRLDTRKQATFRAYIMVRDDSPVRTLADLSGKLFGFGSELSTSSHLMPRLMLERAGLRPGLDVACTYFGHHERAARAVLMGEVAACGVRDLVGDLFKQRGLRVLAQSDPLPNFPLAVARGAPPGLGDALARVLVDVPRGDPAVARLFASWDEELSSGFARPAADEYASVLKLATTLFGPQALTMPLSALTCGPGR
jgi:phosphonate transport system substrate-binding protein